MPEKRALGELERETREATRLLSKGNAVGIPGSGGEKAILVGFYMRCNCSKVLACVEVSWEVVGNIECGLLRLDPLEVKMAPTSSAE